MEATAVSLARSVLDGVLSGAGSAVADEVARLIGVPKEVEFIRNELEMMQSFLRVAAVHPEAAGRTDTVKTWVKQVRDLAYDVEDCLLSFALYAARASSSRAASWLPGALAERHRIAARIRDLKASVEELNHRNLRYHIVVDLPAGGRRGAEDDQAAAAAAGGATMLPDYDVRSAELALKESDTIGRRGEKAELARMIAGRSGAPRVVAVWGMGGMGKSSLVHMVHNDPALLDEFDCGAWVTVPHPLDGADVFARRLRKDLAVPAGESVAAYLRGKRYRVIVDDLLTPEEWDHVWKVFQFDNGKGSRIIVTTRREDVARHCVGHAADAHQHLLELTPLGEEESLDLLCRKVFKTATYTLPNDLEVQAKLILGRCHKLPLAISTIGGLLANRPKTNIEWSKLHEHLGAELESNDNIRKVIVSSYDGLPYHMKSIFLYLSIFPENHEIKRTRLLRRWIAEGYIVKNRDMPVEDVGDRFYGELINRSMIQPSKVSPGNRADRCRVHSMVLQIIVSKSIDENQLHIIEKHSGEVPQSKIRHLVMSRWKTRQEKLQNINLSRVRSLTIFGECPASLISPKLSLLRVLDLEDTSNLKNGDLKHIGELRHLRYLCLRGTDISKLPSSLQNLLYLETLDIQDTKVTKLPGGVAKLEKLRYLLAGINFKKDLLQAMSGSSWKDSSVRAPKGIDKLKNLHMLGVVNVGKGNGVVGRLRKLANLTNLQRLGVTGLTEEEGKELGRSIGELRRLQRLEVRCSSLQFLAEIDGEMVPRHLLSLRFCGNLSSLPGWIRSLNDLAKVKLLGTQLKQGELEVLQALPHLALLGLWENSYIGNSLHFSSGTFTKLKFFDIDGLESIETVRIEEGAMPQLEQLWLNRCPSLKDNKDGLDGVEHLLSLKELLLKNCGEKEILTKILQGKIYEHARRPKFLIGKSIIPDSSLPSTSGIAEQ
ncbi:hypothetical protein ACP4OV_023412 [Aristida adscensionis]